MTIGIDVDDTITYTYKKLIPVVAKYYNIDQKQLESRFYDYDIINHFPMYYEKFLKENRFDELLKDVEIMPNAKEMINKLYEEGNEIIFITARNINEYDDTELATKTLLEKNGIKYNKLYTAAKDKKAVCELCNVDVFIDDCLENCKSVKDANIDAFQMKTVFRKNDPNIPVVDGWTEMYKIIKEKLQSAR